VIKVEALLNINRKKILRVATILTIQCEGG